MNRRWPGEWSHSGLRACDALQTMPLKHGLNSPSSVNQDPATPLHLQPRSGAMGLCYAEAKCMACVVQMPAAPIILSVR